MEVTHNVADENKEEAEELFLLYRPRQGINPSSYINVCIKAYKETNKVSSYSIKLEKCDVTASLSYLCLPNCTLLRSLASLGCISV